MDKRKLCYVSRVESFSSAHRLHSCYLTDEENRKLYGKCGNPNGHGHNYKVKVTLRGPVDPDTGMVMNIADLKVVLQDILNKLLDHKFIDMDNEYFRQTPSTAENIAIYIWEQLKERSQQIAGLLYEVELHETDKNIVTYRGE